MDRCYICGKLILSSYYKDDWGHCVCASHIKDGTVTRCSSCLGFAKTNTTLADGRVYCAECRKNAIFMNSDVNITPVLNYTLKNLAKIGFDNLKMDNVTIEIVSHEQLMKVYSSKKYNRLLGLAVTSHNGYEYSHKIYILSHQNRTQFTATLAHELLHAWQHQNGVEPPIEVCEGICNIGSFYLLSRIKTELSKILIKQMKHDSDHIYGQGFRDTYAVCYKMGWKEFVKYIKKTY